MPYNWPVHAIRIYSRMTRSTQAMPGITAASWQTIDHLNSLIVERTGFMLTESTRTTILPVIDL